MATGRKLLDEIASGALDSTNDLGDLLRRCLVLGSQSGSGNLRAWATQELKGYESPDDVPPYRVLHAALFVDGMNPRIHYTGQRISQSLIPDFAQEVVTEEVRITDGVGTVAAIVRGSDGESIRLGVPGAPDLVGYMNRTVIQWPESISDLYYKVQPSYFEGILDAVRTALVELTAELRAGLPAGADEPNQELVDRAVGVAVHGNNNRIQVTAAASGPAISTNIDNSSITMPGRGNASELLDFAASVGVSGAFLDDLREAARADVEEPEGKEGSRVKAWLARYLTNPAGAVAAGASGELLARAIAHFVGSPF